MFRLTVSALRGKKTRLFLSAAAIALGVAFMTGTLVLTDTLGRAYDNIATNAYSGTDAVVRSDRVAASSTDLKVRGTVDDRTVAAVRGANGVAAAEPLVEGVAQLVGADGKLIDSNRNRATPIATAWYQSPELNPMDLVAGHAPVHANEVVIDRRSARMGHLAVGDRVGVVTATGSSPYVVAGVATYGGADDAGGAHVVAFAPRVAATVLGTSGAYDAIQVVAAPGVSQAAVVDHIRTAISDAGIDHTEVITGAAATAEARKQSHENVAFLNAFLLAFAFVALFVGSFVIANAFSMTVAQRTREHALLRAIGASKRQVVRSVVGESVVTGLIASVVGVGMGIGTASALKALLSGMGLDLPAAPLVVSGRVFVIGIAVGTIVTVLATYLPARRSAKVAPVAAMRDVAVESTRRSAKRTIIGIAITVAGAALIAAGLTGGGIAPVGMGAVTCFFGVAVLGPVIAPVIAEVLGAPMVRFAGVTGSIARENARRNPKRTARTASSLMIGLGLVVFITVVTASFKASFTATVDNTLTSEWIVSTEFGQGGVSPAVAHAIDALPETSVVSPMRYTVGTIDAAPADLAAFDPKTIAHVVKLDVAAGRIADLGTRGIAVRTDTAKAHGWKVGDPITVTFPETGARPLTVAAVYDTREPLGPYAITMATYDANVTDHTDRFVFVADAPGVSRSTASAAIEKVLADYPTAELQTGSEFAKTAASGINQLLNLVYALLAMAVLIALFGIANTLALSVHERTRELGLLRAVGMGRRQVRTAVRYESVIISMLGTTMGMAVGIGFAAAIVHALRSEGVDRLTLPFGTLGVILVVGAIVGIVSAAFPASRAAKLDILEALHAD